MLRQYFFFKQQTMLYLYLFPLLLYFACLKYIHLLRLCYGVEEPATSNHQSTNHLITDARLSFHSYTCTTHMYNVCTLYLL